MSSRLQQPLEADTVKHMLMAFIDEWRFYSDSKHDRARKTSALEQRVTRLKELKCTAEFPLHPGTAAVILDQDSSPHSAARAHQTHNMAHCNRKCEIWRSAVLTAGKYVRFYEGWQKEQGKHGGM